MGRFLRGFIFAFRGLGVLWATQRHFRFDLLIAVLVLIAAGWLGLAPWEWAVILVCIFWVLGMEATNTAIEFLADRVTREQDPLIAHAKDTAAAAVLLSALGAGLVGLLIFLPHF